MSGPALSPIARARADKLLSSVDPVAVVSQHTELHTGGAGPRGRCPIHKGDNTQALAVYPSGLIVCYVCGWRGDVISFVRKMDGRTFREAVIFLEDGNFPASLALAKAREASLEKQTSREREARAYSLTECALEDVNDMIWLREKGFAVANGAGTAWARECESALGMLYDARTRLEERLRVLTEDGAGTRWKLVNEILEVADNAK